MRTLIEERWGVLGGFYIEGMLDGVPEVCSGAEMMKLLMR